MATPVSSSRLFPSFTCSTVAEKIQDRFRPISTKAHTYKTEIEKKARIYHENIKYFFSPEQGIVCFLKKNGAPLVLYTVAWLIIIGGMWVLKGRLNAIHVAIGIGCGAALGTIGSFFTVAVFDKRNQLQANTLWNILNLALHWLGEHGTRPMLISICVTVLLAASGHFPYAVGGGIGCLIANHLMTKVFYSIKVSCKYPVEGNLNLTSGPALESRVEKLEHVVRNVLTRHRLERRSPVRIDSSLIEPMMGKRTPSKPASPQISRKPSLRERASRSSRDLHTPLHGRSRSFRASQQITPLGKSASLPNGVHHEPPK